MHQIDMQTLADEAKFNGFHVKVLLWCLLILIIDGYDIAVVGIALPSIMQQMGVNASTAGFMASSALFGMMFGAMLLGTLSDRIGRRWALSIGSGHSLHVTLADGTTHEFHAIGEREVCLKVILGQCAAGGTTPTVIDKTK